MKYVCACCQLSSANIKISISSLDWCGKKKKQRIMHTEVLYLVIRKTARFQQKEKGQISKEGWLQASKQKLVKHNNERRTGVYCLIR